MKILEKLKNNYVLVIIILIGAILRLFHLDFQSVWLDEIHTLNETNPNLSFTEINTSIMTSEQMPPLYFYCLYILFKIFGYTTFIARLFSALLGVFSIFGIYKLGKEFFNTKIGCLSAFLLAVNTFHIYYSQDARPYILLFLFSIYSFYFLIKFLKEINIKNSLLYGIFTGLMLLSHFFGLFVLFSQMFILLFFFIILEKNKRFPFIKFSFFAVILSLILFIPAIKAFIKVSEIKEFWIPTPTIDVYTLIFKEFFGNSEIILSLLSVFILFYFLKLAKERQTDIKYSEIIENNILFSFIIILPWISIIILVPLIRSYLSAPMIISRYFIVILPAILLIVSIGITYFKNRIIQFGFIVLIFVFTLTDIIIVKKYYTQPNKAQFREATNLIKEKLNNNEDVVSSLGWYLPYFFKDEKVNIIEKDLNTFITEIKSDSSKIKSFWYFDGFGRDYKPSPESLEFINKHYFIETNYDGFQAWTKHFVKLNELPKNIDISKFTISKTYQGESFMNNIEIFEQKENILTSSGWAYFDKVDSKDTQILPILINKTSKKAFNLYSQNITRTDVTSYFKCDFNADNSGYSFNYDINDLEKGQYLFALYVKNKQKNKEGLFISDKSIVKN